MNLNQFAVSPHSASPDERSSGATSGPSLRERVGQRKTNENGTRTDLATDADFYHATESYRCSGKSF